MSESMTCICCPLGCRIHIEKKGETTQITGHRCKEGEEYTLQEIRDPRRFLTTTVPINNGMLSLLPVKSNKELPKNLVKACVIKLSKISVSAPIKCGDLVYKNILGTEVDIIASRDMEER